MTRGKVCPARVNRVCRAMWCTPAGKLIYLNNRVHGNRTLGVVSRPLTTITGYLIKHTTITILNAPKSFLAGSRGRISGYYAVTCYYFMITEIHKDNM